MKFLTKTNMWNENQEAKSLRWKHDVLLFLSTAPAETQPVDCLVASRFRTSSQLQASLGPQWGGLLDPLPPRHHVTQMKWPLLPSSVLGLMQAARGTFSHIHCLRLFAIERGFCSECAWRSYITHTSDCRRKEIYVLSTVDSLLFLLWQ